MTVSTEVDHNEYTGNGVTTSFPYTFRIFKKSDLTVQIADLNENITVLKLDTDYSVTGAGGYNGGNVILSKALANGHQISISRELPVTQETDLRNQGKFFAEVHEDALDKLTMLIQQVGSMFRLALRKPSIIANWYDALNNYIRNVRDPRDPQDAATKNYVDGVANSNLSRTLRTPEPIPSLPNAATRANKIIAFDSAGNPYVTMPPSGSATDVFVELAKPTGPTLIGVQPQGNLSQLLIYVTPEQFGAIGDGTAHPLSERYLTLSAAQAVYPFVTSLTQTIDWAACQAADNYARGKVPVRCPFYANYHFGSTNYLSLGVNSKWYGSDSTMTDSGGATMTRTNGSGFAFGQDAIVRVMDAAAAGSSDQFVRGIVFKGFRLTRGVARRSATKGTSRIGLHLYNAIKAEIDITPNGNEYGLFGYIAWGHKITVRGDSNHKHLFIDAVSASPEYTPPGGEAVTACDIRIEADAGPFGVVLRKCKYTRIHGFVEGAIASASQPNYDYVNETAVAVTLIDCDSIDVSQLGIEAWQGVHLYASGSTVTMTESWTQDSLLLNTTGKHGAFQSMSALTGASELAVLPATNNSYFYALNMSSVTIKNMTCDMSGAGFANTFLCTTNEANSRILFENTKVYFGSSRLLHPLNGYWSNIDTINDPYIPSYLVPSGHTYIGRGKCIALDYTSTTLAADGTATITPPSGYRIIHTEAYLLTSSATQAASGAVTIKSKASDGSTITYQAGKASTAYALYSRLTLQITK